MAAKAAKEAKKLEKLQAEIELRNILKRAELERELGTQAVRRSELDRNWRQMMLKLKEPVFRMDIEVMWHTFDRAYDKKDHLIAHTMRLMNVADTQYQRTVSSFCDTVDAMIVKFLRDMEALSLENDRKTSELLKRADEDKILDKVEHKAAETNLQLLIFHADRATDALAWTTRGENLVKEDEERNKYMNIREDLRSFLEFSCNAMWSEYKAVLKRYITGTAANQKEVRKLRRKENLIADIIAAQAKKIADSDNTIRRLRNELAAYESGTKQAGFRDRRNRHRNACMLLKKKIFAGVDRDFKQLETLVKISDDAIEWLEAARKRGEKILRLAALCRKFETRREKVLPYGSSIPHSMKQKKVRNSNDILEMNALATSSRLSRLWQRMAKVEITKRALLQEKRLLEHENAILVMKLQDRKDKAMTADICKYTCVNTLNNTKVERPVAIDGVLEISKLKLFNKNNI